MTEPRRGLGARAARGVRAACTERLGSKAAALALAVVLWLVVSAEEQTSTWVTVRVAPILDGTVRLAAPTSRVRARVSGPARELMLLGSQPPVLRRPITTDAPDTLRLELLPEDVELPIAAGRVRVREIRPRTITVRLARADAPAPRTRATRPVSNP